MDTNVDLVKPIRYSDLAKRNQITTRERLSRLIVVSNAEPYLHRRVNGHLICENVAGGVSTALDPVLENGDIWIAWGRGDADFDVVDAGDKVTIASIAHKRYTLKRLRLSSDEIACFYYGFSNSMLWPISHCLAHNANSQEGNWEKYWTVNQKFAQAALKELCTDEVIWVHDYQLSLVPQFIRQAAKQARIAFSWHIPFPRWECFRAVPSFSHVLRGILSADYVGFYIPSYVNNFLECASNSGYKVDVIQKIVYVHDRKVNVVPVPLGINYEWFHSRASEEDACARVEELRTTFKDMTILLGIDRLDYTKGLLEKFRSFSAFLKDNPEYIGKVKLIQIVAPSRTELAEYRSLKAQIDQCVDEINRAFQVQDWEPIAYLYQFIPQKDLISYYQIADILLVTSLADGMNLVTKEFVAVRDTGMLVLSNCTGAAEDMREAILVDPRDIQDIAQGIKSAMSMTPEEKRRRFRSLKEVVQKKDVFWWKSQFLKPLLQNRRHFN